MRRPILLLLLSLISGFSFTSCAEPAERKPVGPVSQTPRIPWNSPQPGQGGGALGMLQQNQHRR